jgi:phosphohistidine phosphatase SixA
MRMHARAAKGCAVVAVATALSVGPVWGQALSGDALVTALRAGGHVLVMRHASSPRQVPDDKTANPDNVTRERQLDAAGRAGSEAMGKALRDLRIPVGEVLSSPTYRALETVRYAQLRNPVSVPELGDGGQSMKQVTGAQGAWLRERAQRLPDGTNTIVVTHQPNIASAFPDWDPVADGEVVIVGRDGHGRPAAIGRVKIEEWPLLR